MILHFIFHSSHKTYNLLSIVLSSCLAIFNGLKNILNQLFTMLTILG